MQIDLAPKEKLSQYGKQTKRGKALKTKIKEAISQLKEYHDVDVANFVFTLISMSQPELKEYLKKRGNSLSHVELLLIRAISRATKEGDWRALREILSSFIGMPKQQATITIDRPNIYFDIPISD